jgi:hypothetical protein
MYAVSGGVPPSGACEKEFIRLIDCGSETVDLHVQTNDTPNVWTVHVARNTFQVSQSVSKALDTAVNTATEYAMLLLGQRLEPLDKCLLSSYLGNLSRRYNRIFHEKEAVNASREFCWPPEVFERDANNLSRMGSLSAIIEEAQARQLSFGFNESRVSTSLSEDPNYNILLGIAKDGLVVDTPPGFIRRTSPPGLRPLHRKLINCHRMHALKWWRKGKCLLIPFSRIPPSERSKIHINDTHWTPKPGTATNPGDKIGRPIIDPSNGPENSILNTEETKQLAIQRYGKVSDPHISDLFSSWLRMVESKNISLAECSMWKDDIENAFGQLRFHPSSCLLMCQMVDEEFLMIDLYGNFGWTGLPSAFSRVKSAVVRVVSQRIEGVIDAYVDDFMALSPDSAAMEDQSENEAQCNTIVADEAISMKKRVAPTKEAEMIGWLVNLVTGHVRPNDNGIDKLMFAFFFVDESKSLPLQVYQLLSSLAVRYAEGLRGMKPFVAPLYHMTQRGNTSAKAWSKKPSSAAKFCIEMWRVVAILLWRDRESFSVPLRHMSSLPIPQDGPYCLISDASPWKLSAAIISQDFTIYRYTTLLLPFQVVDNRWQNVREYLGNLLSKFLACVVFGFKPRRWHYIGDNKAALNWAESGRCSSRACQHANLIQSWLQIYAGIEISSTSHRPGEKMGIIDDLSRDKAAESLHKNLYVDLETLAPVLELFRLCDPSVTFNLEDHHTALQRIYQLMSVFSSACLLFPASSVGAKQGR